MTNVSTESKRMMVHSYHGQMYLTTETFPSIVEMKSTLRKRGYTFRNERTADLGDMSEILRKGEDWVEIEEMVESDRTLLIEGKPYVPLSDWARGHEITERRARYAFRQGRLPGMKVGRRNYVYLEADDER